MLIRFIEFFLYSYSNTNAKFGSTCNLPEICERCNLTCVYVRLKFVGSAMIGQPRAKHVGSSGNSSFFVWRGSLETYY